MTRGAQSALLFLLAMLVGWTLAVAKILTDPLPLALAPIFGFPIALFHGLPYLGWRTFRAKSGDGILSHVILAGLLVISEWLLHTVTPFGSWGAAAYTQLEFLPILQFASVAGMAGIGFIIYFFSAALENLFSNPSAASRNSVVLAGVLVIVVSLFGYLRLQISAENTAATVLVAAVVSEMEIKPGSRLPTERELLGFESDLVQKTKTAARAGAKLVAWPEAGLLQYQGGESAFLSRMKRLAKEAQVELIAGYVVPLQLEPLEFENKYVWFRPDGSVDHEYLKRIPVPGEPAIKGDGPMPIVESSFGRLSGAICYDYDFPRLAREHAKKNVDIVVVPANDWRGIDPIHTQMAALRGIEGGHSVLRATASGLSAGVDSYGRVRGMQSSFEEGEGILLVRLPTKGVVTVYGILGDWIIVVLFIAITGAIAVYLRRPQKTS